MRPESIDHTGFAPRRHACAQGRRSAVIVEAMTSLALVLSLFVAVTAVTIGIARADGLAATAKEPHARIAAAILFAVVLVGMSGLTALLSRHDAKAGR